MLAQKLFTHRLYCDDKKIRYVIVRHEQLREQKKFIPCIQGVAYPRIYTDDAGDPVSGWEAEKICINSRL